MRQLFLHIGTHKTGTTALQHYLFHNQAALRSIGWYYPRIGIPHGHIFGHRDLAWSTLRGNAEALEELTSELNTMPPEVNCVISSEDFEFCKRLESLQARLEKYEVTVILYLRRQDDLLLSEYSENLRGGSLFDGDLIQFEKKMSQSKRFDYVALCRRWSEAFGSENLKVRIYTPATSIVDDFCNVTGIDIQQLSPPQRSFANTRIDARLSGAFRLLNQLRKRGLDEATGLKIHETLLAQDNRLEATPKHALMSPRERVKYVKKYKKSNKELSTSFLRGESFTDPLEENAGEVKANPEVIDRELMLAILMAVLIPEKGDDVSSHHTDNTPKSTAPSLESISILSKNLKMMMGRKPSGKTIDNSNDSSIQ
jgi:hypothetical protein